MRLLPTRQKCWNSYPFCHSHHPSTFFLKKAYVSWYCSDISQFSLFFLVLLSICRTYQWCNPHFVIIGIASTFVFMFIKTRGTNTGQVWTTLQSADCRQRTIDNGEEVAEGFLFSFSSKHAQHPCFLPPLSDKPCHRSQDPQWKGKLATKGHKHSYTRLSTASVMNPRGRTQHYQVVSRTLGMQSVTVYITMG